MAFDRPFLFGIIPTWGKWLGRDWGWDATLLAKVAEADCQLAQVDGGWRKVEETQGQYDWAETDHEVDAIINAGMMPYIRLTETPTWAAVDGNPMNSPREEASVIAAFEAFHAAIAERYAAKTPYFEFENEVNRHTWREPQEYGKWLLRARAKLTQGNPNKVLIGCSTLPSDETYLGGVYDYCSSQGVPHPFDRVAVHPYNDQGPIKYSDIVAYRNKMIEKNDVGTNIWITEWGWSITQVNQYRIAQYIADAFSNICFSGNYDYVDGMAYHQFLDIPSSNLYFGLCDDDFTPRPGYRMFSVWAKGCLTAPESRAPLKTIV